MYSFYSFFTLFNDAKNLMRNHFTYLFIASLLFFAVSEGAMMMSAPADGAIHSLLLQYNISNLNDIFQITEQSAERQSQFLSEFVTLMSTYLFVAIFFSLLKLSLLPALIAHVTSASASLLRIVLHSFLMMILFFLFIIAVMIPLSIVITMLPISLYFIIPFFVIVLHLYQVVMIAQPTLSFFEKMKVTFHFLKQELKLILNCMILYMVIYFLLNLIFSLLLQTDWTIYLMSFLLILLDLFVLSFLYRLFLLSMQPR